jgi:hypothetical protein
MSSYTKSEAKAGIKETTNQKGGTAVGTKTSFGSTNPTPSNGINEPKKKSPNQ